MLTWHSRIYVGGECGTVPFIPLILALWNQRMGFEERWLMLEVQSAAGLKNYVYMVYQCPRAVITKDHRLGGFKQQKYSQFQRLEIWNLGDRAMLSLKTPEKNPSLSLLNFWWFLAISLPWLVDTSCQSVSTVVWISPCVSSYKDAGHTGVRPSLSKHDLIVTGLHLQHPIFKPHSQVLGNMSFGEGDTIQPTTHSMHTNMIAFE